MAASLVDAGLHIFHGAEAALAAGRGPFLTLPKLESAQEAALWDAVLARCEAELGIAPNTVRAGVVIETLPAAFAVDEILHALRGRITHLDIGRRGMIRSFAATLGARPEKLLPDRERIVPGKAFLRALSLHVISRAHTRGTLALGGVSTQCLVDGDERAAADAKEKLRADAERAAMDGHDGMRVVQAAMVPVATEVFDRVMPEPNQLGRAREDVEIAQAALCTPHEGPRTQAGVRKCLAALLHVAAARLCGEPAASCSGEMLDIPAAEAAQALLTQWRLARAPLDDGGVVDDALVEGLLSAEADGFGPDAVRLARRFALADGFPRLAELEESEERLKPRVPGDFRHL
jgi:malate synthase